MNQLEGIFRMLTAPEGKVRELGVRALAGLPPGSMHELLGDPGLSSEARAFFSGGGRRSSEPPASPSRVEEVPCAVVEDDSEDDRHPGPAGEAIPEIGCENEGGPGLVLTPEEAADPRKLNTYQLIMRMNAGQKIKTAFRGDKEARNLLIRDSNREVYMAVLENPGLSDAEVEMYAKNTGTNADILRKIARNKDWMSNHVILKALVINPKTPVEVANRFIGRLASKELELLETSKNLSSVLRISAKRLVQARKKKGG